MDLDTKADNMRREFMLKVGAAVAEWEAKTELIGDHDCHAGPESGCLACQRFDETERIENAADLVATIAQRLGIGGVLTVQHKDGNSQVGF